MKQAFAIFAWTLLAAFAFERNVLAESKAPEAEDFAEPLEDGDLSDDVLPPGEEYVSPSMLRKGRASAPQTKRDPIRESELGASDSDFVTLEEHSKQIREYCKYNSKALECLEYRGRVHARPHGLREICREEPLNPRCQKARDKKFDRLLEVQHLCKKEGTKRSRCIAMQKRIYDMPDY